MLVSTATCVYSIFFSGLCVCVCVCSSVLVLGMHAIANKSILVMIMIIVTQVQHKIHVCMYNQPASIVSIHRGNFMVPA